MGQKISTSGKPQQIIVENEEETDNLTALDYYDLALVDIKNQQQARALEHLDKALQKERDFVNAYLERGRIYKSQGRMELAFNDVNSALLLDSKNPLAYILRGTILEDEGELDMAIADFSEAVALSPHDRIGYLHRGKSLFLSRKYREAIQDYNRVLLLNPRDPVAFRNRGLTHRHEGNLHASLNDLNRSIELDPDSANAYLNRSVVLWMKGRSNEISNLFPSEAAKADFVKALKLDPVIFIKALQSTSKLIRLYPNDFYYYLIRGVLHHLNSNENAALNDHTKAFELNPLVIESHTKLYCCIRKDEEKRFTEFVDNFSYYGGNNIQNKRYSTSQIPV